MLFVQKKQRTKLRKYIVFIRHLAFFKTKVENYLKKSISILVK